MVAAVYQERNVWLFQNCGYENHGITDRIPFSLDFLLKFLGLFPENGSICTNLCPNLGL